VLLFSGRTADRCINTTKKCRTTIVDYHCLLQTSIGMHYRRCRGSQMDARSPMQATRHNACFRVSFTQGTKPFMLQPEEPCAALAATWANMAFNIAMAFSHRRSLISHSGHKGEGSAIFDGTWHWYSYAAIVLYRFMPADRLDGHMPGASRSIPSQCSRTSHVLGLVGKNCTHAATLQHTLQITTAHLESRDRLQSARSLVTLGVLD